MQKALSIFFILMPFFLNMPHIVVAEGSQRTTDHTECKTDGECVLITSLTQACAHVDHTSQNLCAAVNKRYGAEIERIECYRNQPCRAPKAIRCEGGHCKGYDTP